MRFLPRPAQQLTIERMVQEPYQLIALRMGGGKTASTLTAANDLLFDHFEVSKVLVVAPKRVAELVWHTEAAKWDHLSQLRVSKVLGSAKERIEALTQDADVYVINRENFTWLVKLVEDSGQPWPFDMVVIDENRGFKDRSSQAWKALKGVRKSIRKLFYLTGTPDPNGDLLDLWPQVSIMDGGRRLGSGITKYRDRFYLPDKRNGQVIYSWKLRQGARQEIHELVKDVMVSVDSGVTTPGRIDNVVPVRFDMKRYLEMQQTMVSGQVMAVNSAVLVGKLAQMANGAVYDDTKGVQPIHDAKLDALEEIVEQGEPVLCFTSFVHDWDRIKARFPKAVKFDGEASMAAWQRGEIELLVMHPASGGHGVDGLQVGGHVAVWFGLPFSLDLYEQANARLDRSGQTDEVVIHHLVAVGTVDERIMRVLQAKGNMQAALLEAVKEIKEQTA
jgi:SNF2 family DNA or RNA helicase